MGNFLSLFQLVIDILQGSILGYFVSNMMHFKKDNIFVRYLIIPIIFVLEILFFDFVYVYEGFYSITYSLTIFLIGKFLSDNRILELLIYSIIFNIMLSVGNSLALLVMYIFFNVGFNEIIESASYLNMTSIFSTLSIFVLSFLTAKIAKKYVSVLIDNSNFYFFAFLIFYVLITLIEDLIFSQPALERELLTIFFVVIFLFLVLLIIFVKNIENSIQKTNLIVINKQMDSFKNRISDFETSSKKIQVIKHDLKRVLYTIRNLIDTKEIDNIKEYIDEQINVVECEPVAIVTGEHYVDSILSLKNLQCSDEKISFSYTIEKNALSIIKEMDMALILLNTLDNAIENVSNSDKKISLLIQVINHMLMIKIENTVDGHILKKNPNLKSMKPASDSHGYGILSLKMIVEKYDGQIDFSQIDNHFICTIVIPA